MPLVSAERCVREVSRDGEPDPTWLWPAACTPARIMVAEVALTLLDAFGALLPPLTGQVPTPVGTSGQVGIAPTFPSFRLKQGHVSNMRELSLRQQVVLLYSGQAR